VVVSNRLPIDVTPQDDGAMAYGRSPGGLVTALEPALRGHGGAWVGWPGAPDLSFDPVEVDGVTSIPVELTAEEIAEYYEGFSNATLWPLYHDVITPPEYHREWHEAYRSVNHKFATAAAEAVAPGGTVWVHDYQLQLAPSMIRELRPDVRIGFFNHIPFPPEALFAQLPWRREILMGLLGADLIGFQRAQDAGNFRSCVRRLTGLPTRGHQILTPGRDGQRRTVLSGAFPISIDSAAVDELARLPRVQARAREIRAELGNPDCVLFGVDRLDYTKGISHRLKAYEELLREGRLGVPGVVMVQVASPSRDNVSAYQALRDDVETTVGRIAGDFGSLGSPAIHYLHQNQPADEMAALYLAADVMLVTALRDGMNLVAKEYVASRVDNRGALVLSEFTGAADELRQAILVNPHDIDGLKASILHAGSMNGREQRRRMQALRRRVMEHDVAAWATSFLDTLAAK
ncbi:MAG: trehalose-6-phosphate synthase, partial [Bifidobacteriaceae bacterium]|jgi:alpha,alpha-trehalose-phosphate synthase [UDP-forming]|nr:trehalose-6-phosphate synthase [Bifidobacteriaceae bacterium]